MTDGEFKEWTAFHTTYKPGFAGWVTEDRGRVNAWREGLRKFSPEVCKTASVHLGMDITLSKLYFQEQFAELIAACRRFAAEDSFIPAAQRSIICSRCSGGGLVSVVPRDHVRVITTVGDTATKPTMRPGMRPKCFAVLCQCDASKRYRYTRADDQPMFAEFDDSKVIDQRELRSGPQRSEEIIAEAEERGLTEVVARYRKCLAGGPLQVDMVDPDQLLQEPDWVGAF